MSIDLSEIPWGSATPPIQTCPRVCDVRTIQQQCGANRFCSVSFCELDAHTIPDYTGTGACSGSPQLYRRTTIITNTVVLAIYLLSYYNIRKTSFACWVCISILYSFLDVNNTFIESWYFLWCKSNYANDDFRVFTVAIVIFLKC